MEELKNEYYNVADIFGDNVFNDAVMQQRLPKKTYQKLKETIQEGKELDLETADVIAPSNNTIFISFIVILHIFHPF